MEGIIHCLFNKVLEEHLRSSLRGEGGGGERGGGRRGRGEGEERGEGGQWVGGWVRLTD